MISTKIKFNFSFAAILIIAFAVVCYVCNENMDLRNKLKDMRPISQDEDVARNFLENARNGI